MSNRLINFLFIAGLSFLLQIHAAQSDAPSRCSVGPAPTGAYGSKVTLQQMFDDPSLGARWTLDMSDGTMFWLEISDDIVKVGHTSRNPANDKIKWVFSITLPGPASKAGQLDYSKVIGRQEMFVYYDPTKSINVGCHEKVNNIKLKFGTNVPHPKGVIVAARKVR